MDYDTKLKIGTKILNELAEDVYTVDSVEYTHDHGVVDVVVKGYSLVSDFEIKHLIQVSAFVRLLEAE